MNTLFGINGMTESHGYSNAVLVMNREAEYLDDWVLRDKEGNYIDHDMARGLLAMRNGLKLVKME
jgi:hypothetical protein